MLFRVTADVKDFEYATEPAWEYREPQPSGPPSATISTVLMIRTATRDHALDDGGFNN